MSKIDALKEMLAEGRFHHATHRHSGPTLWHGLYVYEKDDPNGERFFQRYKLAITFYDGPEEQEAYALVRHTGVCAVSYTAGG